MGIPITGIVGRGTPNQVNLYLYDETPPPQIYYIFAWYVAAHFTDTPMYSIVMGGYVSKLEICVVKKT